MLAAGGKRILGSNVRQRSPFRHYGSLKQIQARVITCRTILSSPGLKPFFPIRTNWFSSSSVPDDQLSPAIGTTVTDETIWKKTTQRIMDQELGTMTPHQWHEAEEALSYWVRQRTSNGVDCAWQLLGRVVKEATQDSSVQAQVTTEWLNRVEDAWRMFLSRDNEVVTMHPQGVVEKPDE